MARRTFLAACAVLMLTAVLAPPLPASTAIDDPLETALHEARLLQDAARGLRNGATAGARADVLAAEGARMRTSLEALVTAHHAWAARLPDSRRTSLAADLSQVDEGCARMRDALAQLEQVVAAPALDRRRLQTLGRAIGRQAHLCSRTLNRIKD